MSLYTRIKEDQLLARKASNSTVINLLTPLLGELNTQTAGTDNVPTDVQVIKLINVFIKNLKTCISLRDSQLAKDELAILETYLPTQLEEAELKRMVTILVTEGKVENKQGGALVGKVMSFLKKEYPDQYDAVKVKELVQQISG